ncbi:Fungalysin metallopeptidase-domain-containing protein [Desarmillaria tabescens]|uniref:Extracellular metalloproteinase n=1 Tax=Armillaria tabescens TaxID=1929756 RepID=A0AA39K1J1_ARMTA|nr:Fungalysin metallopeptidase-domain-containing protein [Desarmillaria tabescens]KAK0450463.1 Fungalysin metallopeptidase-domain-containing protein [Desarmillaria tabescens]
MRAFQRELFSSVLLALLFANVSYAAPWPTSSKHSTHQRRTIGRDLTIDTYHPASTFKTYGEGKAISSFASGNLETSAVSFIASELGVDASTISFNSGHSAENDVSYAYAKQYHDGVPFANAVANVAFKNGNAVSFGSSFVDTPKIASSQPSIELDSIISKVEDALSGTYNDINSLEYLVLSDGSVALTHVVQVLNADANTGYEAFVDAHSGDIIALTDFSSQAAYAVVPITEASVAEGEQLLINPENPSSSPQGWVQNGETAGNNAISYKGVLLTTTQQSSPNIFSYRYNTAIDPLLGGNVDAARTNAFYIINRVHDFLYQYGFTEATYNFQQDNFGKGGQGGDRVQISVQDVSDVNNAEFLTLPDGQSGLCSMYIWTNAIPSRDGSLENDILVHEMTHGLTNRLTGGGTARCLQTLESAGLGEGWSDAMAEWTEQTSSTVSDYVLGVWVSNNPRGIRHYPYSTNPNTNPLRYSSLNALFEVHDIGEVWANMLHNVYAALVQAFGWSSTAMDDATGNAGNVVYLHLFVDALSLQPCNPTFVQARDAWIQADVNRYNGANACLLWNAFASRGLGVSAANHLDDATVPAGC